MIPIKRVVFFISFSILDKGIAELNNFACSKINLDNELTCSSIIFR